MKSNKVTWYVVSHWILVDKSWWQHTYALLLWVTDRWNSSGLMRGPGRRGPSSRHGKHGSCLCLQHEGVWGSGCTAPLILDIGTRWKSEVSFKLPPIQTPTPAITHYLGNCVGPYRSIKHYEYIRPPPSLINLNKFLLSFGTESSVFQFVVQKYKDLYIYIYI